jgi:hypothetical protein
MLVRLLMLVVVACGMVGCATSPAWVDTAEFFEVTVRWHKTEGKAFVDAAGICNIFMEDTPYGVENTPMAPQFNRCAKTTSGFKIPESTDELKNIRLYQVKKKLSVDQRYIDYYGRGALNHLKMEQKSCHTLSARCGTLAFYFPQASHSRFSGIVFVYDKEWGEGVGHELKHIWHGNFHERDGEWKELKVPKKIAAS